MLKKFFTDRLWSVAIALLVVSCSGDETVAQTTNSDAMTQKMYVTIEGTTMTVDLVDNEATRTLVAALQEAPITYEADDYGGFEKVGALGRSLPTSNASVTTQAGDVVLYSGNQIVMFYGSNSWSYTRLGRIQFSTMDELKSFLKAGEGRVSVTLSATDATGITKTSSSSAVRNDGRLFALDGKELKREPTKGLFIKNGKKHIR